MKKEIRNIDDLRKQKRALKKEIAVFEEQLQEGFYEVSHPVESIRSYVQDELDNSEYPFLEKITMVANAVNKGVNAVKLGLALVREYQKRREEEE